MNGKSETTDLIIHDWLRQAEDQRRYAELAISESARQEHIDRACRLRHMAARRASWLEGQTDAE